MVGQTFQHCDMFTSTSGGNARPESYGQTRPLPWPNKLVAGVTGETTHRGVCKVVVVTDHVAIFGGRQWRACLHWNVWGYNESKNNVNW